MAGLLGYVYRCDGIGVMSADVVRHRTNSLNPGRTIGLSLLVKWITNNTS